MTFIFKHPTKYKKEKAENKKIKNKSQFTAFDSMEPGSNKNTSIADGPLINKQPTTKKGKK